MSLYKWLRSWSKLHFKLFHKQVFKMLSARSFGTKYFASLFSPLIVWEPRKLAGGEKIYFRQITWQVQKKATLRLCAATPWVSLNLKFVFKEPLGLRGAPRFTQTHRPLA